jgi:hypothetical protein
MRGRLALFGRASIWAAVLLAAGVSAASASAASPPARPLALWQRWSRAHAAGRPSFTALAAVFMEAGPREVMINGTRYEMGITVFATPGGGSSEPPFGEVDLERPAPRTHPTAFQVHAYSFAPTSGTTFSFDRDSLATSFDLGGTIAPSQFAGTFTATSPVSKRRCTLVTGGHGYLRQAAGTMSYSPFSIVTPTSPFFGTLTAGPVKAGEAFDPGCRGFVVIHFLQPLIAGGARAARHLHRCAGRETVSTASATEEWTFDKVYGKHRTDEIAATGTNPNTQPVDAESHAIIGETPGYDLPLPTHSASGATAKVFSAGNPFMSGGAVFTSTHGPAITGGHKCVALGMTRRFTTLRYVGQLAPNANVLTAAFDTGSVTLTARKATLILRQYH